MIMFYTRKKEGIKKKIKTHAKAVLLVTGTGVQEVNLRIRDCDGCFELQWVDGTGKIGLSPTHLVFKNQFSVHPQFEAQTVIKEDANT